MKTEDRYLLMVVGFIIGWIALMGMGVMATISMIWATGSMLRVAN